MEVDNLVNFPTPVAQPALLPVRPEVLRLLHLPHRLARLAVTRRGVLAGGVLLDLVDFALLEPRVGPVVARLLGGVLALALGVVKLHVLVADLLDFFEGLVHLVVAKCVVVGHFGEALVVGAVVGGGADALVEEEAGAVLVEAHNALASEIENALVVALDARVHFLELIVRQVRVVLTLSVGQLRVRLLERVDLHDRGVLPGADRDPPQAAKHDIHGGVRAAAVDVKGGDHVPLGHLLLHGAGADLGLLLLELRGVDDANRDVELDRGLPHDHFDLLDLHERREALDVETQHGLADVADGEGLALGEVELHGANRGGLLELEPVLNPWDGAGDETRSVEDGVVGVVEARDADAHEGGARQRRDGGHEGFEVTLAALATGVCEPCVLEEALGEGPAQCRLSDVCLSDHVHVVRLDLEVLVERSREAEYAALGETAEGDDFLDV
mmetsp:Transcript_11659/g.30810  ORF Transcript_11659/g.30810 Transcript_11659/m.30810 type:complete len:442 (-) Transcript_11659:605-1930(-)